MFLKGFPFTKEIIVQFIKRKKIINKLKNKEKEVVFPH
jgi:hypothetical protein